MTYETRANIKPFEELPRKRNTRIASVTADNNKGIANNKKKVEAIAANFQ